MEKGNSQSRINRWRRREVKEEVRGFCLAELNILKLFIACNKLWDEANFL